MFREFYAPRTLDSVRNCKRPQGLLPRILPQPPERTFAMVWSTPILIEICIGLEINGYLPAEL